MIILKMSKQLYHKINYVITCEINHILNWLAKCIIAATIEATKFAETDRKLYVLVVTMSAKDNAKLLEELKPGFKQTNEININQMRKKFLKIHI